MGIIIKELENSGKKFIKINRKDDKDAPYSRYDSWDFCYKKFMDFSKKKSLTEDDYDLLALNLGFYLASWGMYRGSSFLLQNNYKIHKEPAKIIIKFIQENRKKISNDEALDWDVIEEIKKDLTSYYSNVFFYKNDEKKQGSVTDTLVTKILMGTIGIVPAYDKNVKYCLKNLEIPQTFGKKSYEQINEFYNDNDAFTDIQKLANEKSKYGIKYPRMKILDMCMWQYYVDNVEEDDN